MNDFVTSVSVLVDHSVGKSMIFVLKMLIEISGAPSVVGCIASYDPSQVSQIEISLPLTAILRIRVVVHSVLKALTDTGDSDETRNSEKLPVSSKIWSRRHQSTA